MDDDLGSGEKSVVGAMSAEVARPRARTTRRVAPVSGILALALILLPACRSTTPTVVDPTVVALKERPVVIFVSGLTGTVLHDRVENRVTWGDFRSVFLPRDLGYATALPIGGAEDRLEAREPIEEFRLGPLYRREVYGAVVKTFEANGFRKDDDLYLFGYDWRRSNVESGRRLARFVDDVARERPVILVCQSNGGYLCRWAVRFGDVSLDEAERGVVRRPRAGLEALVFLGTANGGSIRILRELNRGRTYVKFGRFFSPEVFFTIESLYQDLPSFRGDLFVDEEGRAIDVDLFDAAAWERYGWSVFEAEAGGRADRRPDLFGGRDERLAFLRRALGDARRFHAVLRDGVAPPASIRLYSIQNRTRRTVNRAMLVERDGTWRTLFIGDELVESLIASRPGLESVMAAAGDLHASAEGQDALASCEKALLAEPVIEVDGDHLGVMLSPESHRAILRIIREGGVERRK